MKGMYLTGMVLAGVAAAVVAAPPGPLDGDNIPSNFGAGNLAATQTNWTGFGNYTVTPGGFIEGNETDALYLSIGGGKLYVGLTGNLSQNGETWMICIGTPGHAGQTESRAEAVGGPPFTLQTSGRTLAISTNGTPLDDTDDTWAYDLNGMTFPCETDYVVAIDAFGGTMSVSEYELFDPAGAAPDSNDPTPGNLGDPLQSLWALRAFASQGPVGDANGLMENDQLIGYEEGGFDNTNVAGVSDVDGSSAATATTGLEMGIPLSRLGLVGTETIDLYILHMDGSDEGTATVTNQVLPPLGAGAPCDPADVIGLRTDLTAVMSCLPVDLSALLAFAGITEGDLSDPATEGYTLMSTQTCPTPYGDQQFDPLALTRGGGSELNELYVTDDGVNLYLGLTGNLQENGNKLNIWFDNGIGTNGDNPLVWDNLNVQGMEGDLMPSFAADPTGPRPLYDYAVSVNVGGVDGAREVFADLWDLVGQVSTFKGRSFMESGNGDLDTLGVGSNQWDMQVALNNLNSVGIAGCSTFEALCSGDPDGTASWFDTPAQVAARALTANSGFEICVPLADLGINPCDGPSSITFWAHITGDQGWRSNQSLPTMREVTCDMVENNGDLVTDWYNPNAPCGPNPERYYRSVAVTHAVTFAGAINDCNSNGLEDTCEILDLSVLDCNFNGAPDSCDLASGASPDCNTNNIPDECDLGTGFSLDANTNGIPDECEASACAASAARSCNLHGATPLCLDILANNIEPRLSGVTSVEIDVDAGTATSATVSCVTGGDLSASASVSQAASTVTVTLAPALPDGDACTITLDCGASVCVRGLAGDIDRNGIVSTGDASIIKPHFGESATVAGAEFDFDQNDIVSTGDASIVKPRFGNSVVACP